MRLFLAVKPGMIWSRKDKEFAAGSLILAAGFFCTALLTSSRSFAQAYIPPVQPTAPVYQYAPQPYQAQTSQQPYQQPVIGLGNTYNNNSMIPVPTSQPPMDRSALLQALTALQSQPTDSSGKPNPLYKAPPPPDLGSITDPNSPAYKANQLAIEAQKQRADSASVGQQGIADDTGLDQQTPPPDVQALQQINKMQASAGNSISDDPASKEIALDMRKAAQKEAALSYGARGGLAKRNFQIMERMQGFDTVLDRVFNFRSLLIKAPSGLLIEPPIIKESVDALVITDGGDEAAVADKVFDINKKAKIVSAPRDWRQYLLQSWSKVPPPPRVLWPRTPQEQASWSTWVAQGWDAGFEQADQIFEANVNQLVADYDGMVRYRMLLAQDMISAPYAMHEDRGVTGDKSQMRVGDRAVRITGPSQFLTKAELWKPADQ